MKLNEVVAIGLRESGASEAEIKEVLEAAIRTIDPVIGETEVPKKRAQEIIALMVAKRGEFKSRVQKYGAAAALFQNECEMKIIEKSFKTRAQGN